MLENSFPVLVADVVAGKTAHKKNGSDELVERADELLALVGLWESRERAAKTLAHGEQRALEIGMALATRPKLLLLDEVAAGLTESEVDAMAQLIRRLRDELDLSVIWIEHAVTTLLQYVERVIVLHQGRKIADGTPAEVVRNALLSARSRIAFTATRR